MLLASASRGVRGAVVLCAAAVLVSLTGTAPAGAATKSVTVTVDRTVPDGTSGMAVGVTLATQHLATHGDAAAMASGKQVVRTAARYQVQHLMGHGALNPEPTPGVFDWASLDARMRLITETGGTPVIDLFGAPDWMKGGAPGRTDWSRLEVAPLPEYYDEYAELSRQVALRYPQVRHFMVWSETKGFWNKSLGFYDPVAYTRLYNQVFTALKSVRPDIQVGGPYLVLEGTGSRRDSSVYTAAPLVSRNKTFLQHWLTYKKGADFLVVDRKLAQRADTNTYSRAQLMALTPWFRKVTESLRALTPLPIWYAESYFRCDPDEQFMAAGLASMLYHQLKGGAAVSIRWAAERQAAASGCEYAADSLQNLFTSTRYAGGGKVLPATAVYQAFHQHFAPGTPLVKATSSSPLLEVLATLTKTLLINKDGYQVDVWLNGQRITLPPYGVRVV